MKRRTVSSGCARHAQRGVLLITSAVLIVAVVLLLTVMLLLGVTGKESSAGHSLSRLALFMAESEAERALHGFTGEGVDCVNLSYTATLGADGFIADSMPHTPVAIALTADISDTDTVIPLADASGYASFGRVSIGVEQIHYGAVSIMGCAPFDPPCLTAAQRGVAGTMAVPHAAGQAVSQNRCLMDSTGTVGSAPPALHPAGSEGGS